MDPIPLIQQIANLKRGIELVLLFYQSGDWSLKKRARWQEITGNDDWCTKGMCDHLRSLLDADASSSKCVSRGTLQKESQDCP